MTSRSLAGLALAVIVLVAAPACQRDLTGLEEAEFPGNAEIFVDGYAEGVTYQAFAGSKPDAVAVDQSVFYRGGSSLRIEVPLPTNPGGSYAGGAFTSNTPRDLTEYNALTFWARASIPAALNVAGLGNNNTGESQYPAETANLQLTTDWQQYAIPFPLPSKLDQEDGLFFFAEGAEAGSGYTFWIDELQFADLNTVSNPRPVIADQQVSGAVGDTVVVTGTTVTYEVSGQDITVAAAPAYFAFTSSDPTVATVDERGRIAIVGEGSADVTGSLGSVAATGTVTVTAGGVSTAPATAAPAPMQAEADVISLFSDAYTDVTVDTWRTDWSSATLEDVTIDGSAMKKYTALDFVGIETVSSQVDASAMTHLHVDIWTPDATFFAVKLVDFGPDGAFGGGDDTESQVDFDGTANPAPAQGQWVSLDIPLTDFTAMNLANIAQMILVGQPTGATTVFVDNVYFYAGDGGGGGGAQVDLPITFDDPSVDYVLTDFEGGGPTTLVADPTDASNTVARTVKSVSAGTSAGTTMTGPTGLASGIPFTASNTTMTVRVYSPDAGVPVRLKVENNENPGQSVETEASTTVANSWETLTFDFSNQATGTAALNLAFTYDKASIFFNFGTDGAAAGEKIYLWDDVAFGSGGAGGGPIPPTAPAPAPTQDAADVISIYSDSYTDVGNQGFAQYGAAAFAEVDIAGSGNSALQYTFVDGAGGNFQVMELGAANQIDAAAAGMTNFRFDVYFPNELGASSEFLLKLVDFGAATTEANIYVNASSTPAIAQGTWLSFDLELASLTGLGGTSNIQQVVVDLLTSGEVYIDNIYFYAGGGAGGGAQVDLPITFDDPAVSYVLADFEGAGPSTLEADPTDPTNTVARTVKDAGAGTSAGTTMTGPAGLASVIPFTASNTTMTVRVYSPDAGIPVRLKVENAGDPTQSVETEASTTVANSWETLTFDFSNQATGTAALNLAFTYDKPSIFFNFGTDGATAGEKIYLWDDVSFQN